MDIKTNQIPGILGGVGPTYSFVQLYQGLKDLFWLPVQQYRQDGRLVRGLQKGAHSFSTSTAMALLEITNRIVQTVQVFSALNSFGCCCCLLSCDTPGGTWII